MIDDSQLTTQARVQRMVTSLTIEGKMSPTAAYTQVANELGLAVSTVKQYYYTKGKRVRDRARIKTAIKVAHKPSAATTSNGLTPVEKVAATMLVGDRENAEKVFNRKFLDGVVLKTLKLIE